VDLLFSCLSVVSVTDQGLLAEAELMPEEFQLLWEGEDHDFAELVFYLVIPGPSLASVLA
jgi:hypothetical protein